MSINYQVHGHYVLPLFFNVLTLMLDYSIRGLHTPSISPVFYGWTGRRGYSSMISKPRSWVQSPTPPGHAFSSATRNNSYPPYCLLSMHMARACGCDSHTGGIMLDYSIRCPIAPSILPGFYGWTGMGGYSSS
jgi:hypothetical protein